MTTTNIFEVAVRSKFRFPFKGQITVEDMFDLSLENLDSVFKSLNSQAKQVKEESLLNTKTKEDKELDLKIEIVKYIVNAKLEERDKKLKEKEQSDEKQKLLGILNKKQNQALEELTVEQIQEKLRVLEGK